jgi:hypothetical protein
MVTTVKAHKQIRELVYPFIGIHIYVRPEVLTAAVMNVATFCDRALCMPYENKHFGGHVTIFRG